jgi:hypothetical protein
VAVRTIDAGEVYAAWFAGAVKVTVGGATGIPLIMKLAAGDDILDTAGFTTVTDIVPD